MPRLRFKFNIEKFIDVMVFFAERIEDLSTLKAAKLLYLADRAHLLKYGRPILGDWYACMEHGPVPSQSYDLLKEVRDTDRSFELSGSALVKKHLRVEQIPGDFPVFRSNNSTSLDALSESEQEIIQEIVNSYGEKKASYLVSLTHDHKGWKECFRNDEHVLPYEKFFDDEPIEPAFQELIRSEQENREIVDWLISGE